MPEAWATCEASGCNSNCGSSERYCAVHKDAFNTGEPMEIAWQLLKAGPPAEAFLPHDIDDEGNVIEENEPPKKDPLRSRLSLQHLARRGDDHAKEMEGERPPGEEPLPEQHMAGQHENTRMNEMAREAAGTMPDLHELEPEMRDDTTTVIRPNRRGEYGERYLGEKHPPRTFRDLNVPEVPHGYEEEEEEPEPDPHDWSPKDRGPYIQRLREMGLMDDDDDKPPTTAQTQGQAEGAMSNDALKLLGREHAMRRR